MRHRWIRQPWCLLGSPWNRDHLRPFVRDQPLLWKCCDILHSVIEVQSRREVQEKHGHQNREKVGHHLGLWIRWSIANPDPGENEHRESHEDRHDVVGILQRDVRQPEKGYAPKLDRILEHEEEREQDRHGEQHRETPYHRTEGRHVVLLVHPHHLAALLLRIVLISLLYLHELRLDLLHTQTRTHGTLVQRPECNPDRNSEDHEHPPVIQLESVANP